MKPLHILLTILLAIVASYATVQLAGKDEGHAITRETAFERIMRTGTIRCGYATWAPAVTADPSTGQLSGRNVDIMNAIGEYLELKVEWTVETGWGNFIEDMRAGKFDVMCATVWPDAGRVKGALLTQPLFFNGVYALVRADDARFATIDSLPDSADVKIAVIDGDMTASVADASFPAAEKYRLPNTADGSHLAVSVETGKADATFADLGYFADYNAKNPGKIKVLSHTPQAVFGEALAMPRGEHDLKAMLESAVTELNHRGVIAKILAAWPGALTKKPEYMLADEAQR